ncbi:hypothetical protein [Lactococcus garvieae]|uniref:hypothetical protein n=1 Tax=Lactococcus garvieae TaxID=1363 RepID=UPI00254C4D35|nr:hypothetical protein [Lactococcus garvieae]
MSKNLSIQITKYIGEQPGKVEAKNIYKKFNDAGFTSGQISGVLTRLKEKGRLVSPERGYYENTNSRNVLDELKRDLSNLLDKYDRSVPISIFEALNPEDKKKYTEIIKSLKKFS